MDENLDFWMDPIEFKGTPSGLYCKVLDDGRGKKLFYYFINNSSGGDSSCFLLFDPVTRKIVRRNTKLPKENLSIAPLLTSRDKVTFNDKQGNFYFVNDQLELIRIKTEKDFQPSGFIG